MSTEWTGARLQPRPSLAEQVVTDLRQAIKDGAFGTNGQLPSEPALSQQLGVSRPTIRQAISVLEQEGLVVRRQGHGTFVMSSVVELPNILNVNTGITDMIRAAGKRPDTKQTSVRQSVADERLAEALGVEVGAPVTVIERIRTADDQPVALTRDFVRTDRLSARGVSAQRLEEFVGGADSLYSSLAEIGIPVTYGVAKVLPARATKHLAAALALKPNTDLLLLEQTDYSGAGSPVLFSQEYLVPGPLAIFVYRRGPG
ncbi:GntR family transcriptional regulator [Micromonospora sp. NPDC005305]|uniref:GntR family transcriptional regulator n=1 Tax=Micromonospora sp. NPDC005305 TaxID=3156875 RepID=UPI0033AAB34A